MPLSDEVRRVGEVLTRADSLFGIADAAVTAGGARDLTDAVDAIRSGQQQAAAMAGDAVTGYADLAQDTRETLDHLGSVDTDLNRRLQEAADALSAATAASHSSLDVVSSVSDTLDHVTQSPAVELAVLHALRAQVARQLALIRNHQAIAEELGAHLRGLDY